MKFLPVGRYKMNQTVSHVQIWDSLIRVTFILYSGVAVVRYIIVSSGICNVLSVFRQFTGEICILKSQRKILKESRSCCSMPMI